jgi:hypothetical protein
MRIAFLATTFILAGSTFAFAVPARVGVAGQFSQMAENSVTLVAQDKAKKSKKSKKSGSKPSGGNMPGMPPGHKM